jgi:exopolysaccharide biosynthesis WecB/TagA/CpsF family protein
MLYKSALQVAKNAYTIRATTNYTGILCSLMSLTCTLDDYDVEGFLRLAAHFGGGKFGYAVTPNVDHLIRYHDDAHFRDLYADAAFVLLDSRFLSHIFRFSKRLRIRVCAGSDLTAQLFARVIQPDDKIVLIGCSSEQVTLLRDKFGLKALEHYNPPMGFIRDPQQVEACLKFIEAHSPFRFCFLAVGAPQQEVLAQALKTRGVARGLALCIGASINFLTGIERRAPRWMQQLGMEWIFRLSQDPVRLAKRYLVRGPRVFSLLPVTKFLVRPSVALPAAPTPTTQPLAN